LNAAQNTAALLRLEAAQLPRLPLVEQLAGEHLGNRVDDFEYEYGENTEQSNQLPGHEDNEDDDANDEGVAWVTLTEEEPDHIDTMVHASNERYRQRAREVNWQSLLETLHPMYMVLKLHTNNWTGSNTFDDFPITCPCPAKSKSKRFVDLVDLHGQQRLFVTVAHIPQLLVDKLPRRNVAFHHRAYRIC